MDDRKAFSHVASNSTRSASIEEKTWIGYVAEGQGDRADKFIADHAKIMTRSQIKARKEIGRAHV